MSQKKQGMIYGAISAASYGMTPLFAVPLYGQGLSVDGVLFLRYILAALMMCAMILMRGGSLRISRREVLPLLVMAGFYCVSSLFLFEGYKVMDAGITATIFFAYPAMVALIMGIVFKERISRLVWGCIIVTMGGISLLSETSGGKPIDGTGVVLVLLSALAYVLYMIGVNKSVLKTMEAGKLSFYVLLLGGLVFLFRLQPLTQGIPLPSTAIGWIEVLCLAFIPTVISLITLTRSINYIGSTLTAVLGAFEPVTALFLGVLVFSERLTAANLFGVVLVITAVTAIACEDLIQQFWKNHRPSKHLSSSR